MSRDCRDSNWRPPSWTSAAHVDEFWAWIPTVERFTEWFKLGGEASEVFDRCWNIDLQMLRTLVNPWPRGWPSHLHNLNAAAVAAGVEIPQRAENHLHPRVHAEWTPKLVELDAFPRARSAEFEGVCAFGTTDGGSSDGRPRRIVPSWETNLPPTPDLSPAQRAAGSLISSGRA